MVHVGLRLNTHISTVIGQKNKYGPSTFLAFSGLIHQHSSPSLARDLAPISRSRIVGLNRALLCVAILTSIHIFLIDPTLFPAPISDPFNCLLSLSWLRPSLYIQ